MKPEYCIFVELIWVSNEESNNLVFPAQHYGKPILLSVLKNNNNKTTTMDKSVKKKETCSADQTWRKTNFHLEYMSATQDPEPTEKNFGTAQLWLGISACCYFYADESEIILLCENSYLQNIYTPATNYPIDYISKSYASSSKKNRKWI